jgi:glutathione S-transferase
MPDVAKAIAKTRLNDRLQWLNGELAGKDYLLGDCFSVADAYLFVVAGWCKHVGIDVSGLNNLTEFMARVSARPAVQEALRAEGLV